MITQLGCPPTNMLNNYMSDNNMSNDLITSIGDEFNNKDLHFK